MKILVFGKVPGKFKWEGWKGTCKLCGCVVLVGSDDVVDTLFFDMFPRVGCPTDYCVGSIRIYNPYPWKPGNI